jgi:S-adenosylmethionine:tRNA ribosyltransferase-isomerase
LSPLRLDDFDYELPPDRIALRPVRPRDAARLLTVSPDRPEPLHDRCVTDLPQLLEPGDALIFNDTRVIPAGLTGTRRRGETGAHVEVTLYQRLDGARWRAFARPAKRLKPSDRIAFGPGEKAVLWASVEERGAEGEVTLAFELEGDELDAALREAGHMPLPPYIGRKRPPDGQDLEDYQTVYAAHEGAVAAPTAGLHFSSDLLEALNKRGIALHFVTLHVGPGTFLPVKQDDVRRHRMFPEWGEVDAATAHSLNAVRSAGGRRIAVGTTALRLLESASHDDGEIEAFRGETELFITPGYRFKAVDLLLTNFHLPRSTLFMLVAAFSGLGLMKRAYSHAVRSGYRFYSYGDACLLEPARATP